MGDPIDMEEELMAEVDDEDGYIQYFIAAGLGLISTYGWYILAALLALYFLWKNYGHQLNSVFPETTTTQATEKDVVAFQSKEEARQKYVAKLQEQYEKEAAARAEQLKAKDEEKRQKRLQELEKLTGSGKTDGQRLGTKNGNSSNQPGNSKPKSLRPEYNPLMGDTTSYRPCNRESGRSGG